MDVTWFRRKEPGFSSKPREPVSEASKQTCAAARSFILLRSLIITDATFCIQGEAVPIDDFLNSYLPPSVLFLIYLNHTFNLISRARCTQFSFSHYEFSTHSFNQNDLKMNTMHRQFGKLMSKGAGDNAKVSVLIADYEDADKTLTKAGAMTRFC